MIALIALFEEIFCHLFPIFLFNSAKQVRERETNTI